MCNVLECSSRTPAAGACFAWLFYFVTCIMIRKAHCVVCFSGQAIISPATGTEHTCQLLDRGPDAEADAALLGSACKGIMHVLHHVIAEV